MKTGYIVRHQEYGYLVDEQLTTQNPNQAHVFNSPEDVVQTCLKVWGEDLQARKVQILKGVVS